MFYTKKIILFIITIVIIFINTIITIIYFIIDNKNNNNNNNNNNNDNNNNNNGINNNNNNNNNILYDGKMLAYPAKKNLLYNKNIDTKLNCNSNIIECKRDADCDKKCLNFKHHSNKCLTGLCQYINNNNSLICKNGGEVTSYFMYGRLYSTCICPENYIGLYCQIPNEMNSSYSRTFQLFY